MAMVECEECRHPVSDEAKACPGCGAPMPRKRIPLRSAAGACIVAGFILTAVVAIGDFGVPISGPILVAIGIALLGASWFMPDR
jgi:hypothetical protein